MPTPRSAHGHGEGERDAAGARKRTALRFVAPGPETLEGLAAFFRRLWDPDSTAARVQDWLERAAKENPNRPGEPPPTLLLLRDGVVVGYVGTIPVRLWQRGAERPMYFVKGLSVLPEHRNGPAAFLLLQEFTKRLPCAMCLTVIPMLRGMFTRAGYAELGPLPNHLRVLDPGVVLELLDTDALGLPLSPVMRRLVDVARSAPLRPLAATGARAGLSGWSLLARGRGSIRVVEPAGVDPGEVDDLWLRSCRRLESAPVRNAAYLLPRYLEGGFYVAVEVRQGGRLEGMAFVRRPREDPDSRLRGIRVATLSDLLTPPTAATLPSLLRGAEEVARELGSHGLLLTASHEALARVGFRRGYVPVPGNIWAYFRDSSDPSPRCPPLGEWWLTRGDSESDGVF